MKKLLSYIALFLLLVAALDFGVGQLMSSLTRSASGGETRRALDIADQITDSVLILGSSRALYHYNPLIIEDSTSLPTYNCGLIANGILFNYGQFHILSQRYTPKVIIYEWTPGFDYFENQSISNHLHLNPLKIFYDRPGIPEIFTSVSPDYRLKMLSQMFRYNTRWIQIISDNIRPMQQSIKGFKTLDGVMSTGNQPATMPQLPVDSVKLKYVERLASECRDKGIRLIFAVSPLYGVQSYSHADLVRPIAEAYGAEVWDYQNDPDICTDRQLFRDSSHLNPQGADTYSAKIASRLKSSINPVSRTK